MANAALSIDIPADTAGLLFSKSYDASAIAQVSAFEMLTSPRDHIIYGFNGAAAKFHGPDSLANKSPGDDKLTSSRVIVETMYKIFEFYDKHYDDAIGRKIISQIEAKIPGIMAMSLDRVPFGQEAIADSPFDGFTETPAEVDETADSWLEALATLEATGYKPSAFILDNKFKAAVRKAFTEGSNVNPLTFGVSDGFSIAGIPVYFRDLGSDTEGNPFGAVAQWDQGVLVSYDEFDAVEIHLPNGDWTLRQANRVGAYAGWRVGYGVADQKAFLPLKLVAAVTG